MKREARKILLASLAVALGLAIGCSDDPADPLSPSDNGAGANSEASTLKVSAPTPVSPKDGQKPNLGLELVLTNASSAFGQPADVLSYRFEIYDASGARVYESDLVGSGSGTTSHVPGANLNVDQNYEWRARAEYQGAAGPWSERAKFVASQTTGYLRADEIYDPLIDGKTVGVIHGPVTFLPGVGVRLDSEASYIEYPLATTLTGGEFSAFVSNLGIVSPDEDPKLRVLSMRQGGEQFNDNDYRMSVEKRGNGKVAFRFISGDNRPGNYIESGPPDRIQLNFDRGTSYFWKVTWGNNLFNYSINEDSANGKLFYDLGGRSYGGVYDPQPHTAALGSAYESGDRGEPGSIEDGIFRQVWISRNPRPAFANR
jgi:hypothetical protein